MSHFEFLALLVLFMIFLIFVINCLCELSSVYFWGTPEFKKGIGVIVHLQIVFVSTDVTFFEDTPFFVTPTTSDSTSHVIPIPLFEPFVPAQRPPRSQSSSEFRRLSCSICS